MATEPETREDDESRTADAGPEPPRSKRTSPRPLLLRLHFYAGLLVAPFLFVAAFSGMLYAASIQVEKFVYDHELNVPVGEEHLPIDEQIAAARAEFPERTVNAVRPASEEGTTTRVLLDAPELGPSQQLAIFVDPYTAEVRGDLAAYGSSSALPFRWWIDELHRNLHLGEFGRHYSELAASWLGVIALVGIVLWIGQRRTRRRVRRTLLPERGLKGRRATLTWHGTIGLWVALVLCFLSVTGLTWSQHAGEHITQLRGEMSWQTPAVDTSPPGAGDSSGHSTHGGRDDGEDHGDHGEHSEHGDHSEHGAHGQDEAHSQEITAGQALESGRSVGLRDPVEIVYPTEPGAAFAVKEVQAQWPTQVDAVAVDPTTGEITDTVRFDDYSVVAKLARWGVDGHMGLLFGLPNQLVLIGVALSLMTLIVLGYRMWWLRRPTRGGALTWGRPPRRGAWRGAPWAVLLPLLAVAAVLGWYVPLLGLSLLAFLTVDAALGLLHHRRGAARKPAPAEAGESATAEGERPGGP
ncbi:PepSY-associated TM helix domain-containing protein [Streptomyces profundus]|uniref:PepSY-associated TM helix domain-containing protein n=1 Tax=Streptomyces profundus TaxID=2867410 RepID=UPI001D16698A|nr:PepSY domain-containing protein [Streptomyces sp. MA3_2.13]UED87586.1 PepSY domain-containing protein [Streptomyces sp. MA3_2.13]